MKHPQQGEGRSNRWTRCLLQLNSWLMRMEGLIAVTLLLILLVSMCAQVIARYGFRSPFSWSEELARFAMIWLTMIAASLVMARREHITVDLWVYKGGWQLPSRIKLLFDCLVELTVVVTCLLLLFGGFRFVWFVHPVGSPALSIPKSAWYGAISVGLALMALHSLLHLLMLPLSQTQENVAEQEKAP